MKLNIKTVFAALAACCVAMTFSTTADAKKMSDLRIYINPGHGGYTSNDRPIRIHPFESNDTLGYWESKSNLYKGLHMYHILDSLGATPFLSRIKNTEADDRSLSGIAAEANGLNVDLFFSIHSNAGESVNYPLMLYREQVIGTPRYPESVTLSKILWRNLHSSKLPVWTKDTEYVAGDLTFYQNMWQGGLGVLRTLYVPGLLSEGSMHEHRPEAHRLMNDDYCWLEAWHFVKTIMEFFDTEDRFVTGNVAGIVYDDNNLREFVMPCNFSNYGRDRLAPVNGAFVELVNGDGKTIQTRTTDDMYNGVFVFRNVTPGNYTVRVNHKDYYTEETAVTVTANEVTYQDMPLNLKREQPLAITAYTPNVSESETVSCASTIVIDFSTDIDVPSFEAGFKIEPAIDGYLTYSNSYRRVTFTPTVSFELNTKYTVSIAETVKSADKHYSHPQLEAPVTFSFMTRGRNRLELVDQFPVDGGEIHHTSPRIELRFDNVLSTPGFYDLLSITDSKGNKVSVNQRTTKFNTLSNNYGNAVIAFSDITPGENYTLTLKGDVRDKEGLPTNKEITVNFKAVDAASPELDPEKSNVFEKFEDAANFTYNEEGSVGLAAKPAVTKSTSTKLFDKSGARLTYKFADTHGGQVRWSYTGASQQFSTGDHIGLYVNGDFNNHELWVGMVSGTNVKYTKVCDLNFLGWKYCEVSLDNLEADFCPFILGEVKLVQKTSPITQNGVIAFDDLTFIKGTGGVENITSDDAQQPAAFVEGGNIFVVGFTPDTVVNVYSISGALLTSVRTGEDGSARIAASHLGAGIYIVAGGPHALRVAK